MCPCGDSYFGFEDLAFKCDECFFEAELDEMFDGFLSILVGCFIAQKNFVYCLHSQFRVDTWVQALHIQCEKVHIFVFQCVLNMRKCNEE